MRHLNHCYFHKKYELVRNMYSNQDIEPCWYLFCIIHVRQDMHPSLTAELEQCWISIFEIYFLGTILTTGHQRYKTELLSSENLQSSWARTMGQPICHSESGGLSGAPGEKRAGRVGESVSEDRKVARQTRSRRGPPWESKTKHKRNKENQRDRQTKPPSHGNAHGRQGVGEPSLRMRMKAEMPRQRQA